MRRAALMMTVCFLLVAGCGAARQPVAEYAQQNEGMELVPSVRFAFGSERALARERWIVEHNARWLVQHPEAVLVLEGHCDERGSQEFNRALGDRRARGVLGALMRQGIAAERLVVVSHGEARPLDGSRTPQAWATNRRVAFVAR